MMNFKPGNDRYQTECNKHLGRTLKLIRHFHGVKIRKFAEDVSLSPKFVSELESGAKMPSIEVLTKYCGYFPIRMSEIFKFVEYLGGCEDSTPYIMEEFLLTFYGHENLYCHKYINSGEK